MGNNRAILIALVAACGGDTDNTCSIDPDTCTDDAICIVDTCAPVRPRAYRITGITMRAPMTKPDGSPWDAGGGATAAPDMFAIVESIDNRGSARVIATTPPTNDAFTAFHLTPIAVDLETGLRFQVFDEDSVVDDAVFTCNATPLTAAELRLRTLACETMGYSVAFTIEP